MQQKINLGIDGMHCASCSARVENALSKLPGVSSAHVNLALEEAFIDYDDKKLRPEVFGQTIAKLGFQVREEGYQDENEQLKQMELARKRMLVSWVITLAVLIFMLPHMVFKAAIIGHKADAWLMFGLSLIAMLFPARAVYVSAFKSVRSGGANMDVLIAMGTLASLLVAPLSLMVKGLSPHDFAGIAAMIISFHLSGRYLEAKAKGRASEAIRKLLNLGAKTALIRLDGKETEIPVRKLQIGDIFLVKPGTKVPTDGVVIKGSSSLDESMATGESLPANRKEGDRVLGATLNLDGYLEVKATQVGADTFLAQVIRLVSEAQHSKVPIQLLADRITSIFVPVVLVLAFSVFTAWMLFPQLMNAAASLISSLIPLRLPSTGLSAALFASIATLVIACPCALGLATPTALMVGSGIGAQRGILIRNGEALQRMKDLKVIVFDKTGTLTQGKPELIHIETLSGTEQENLAWAAALEEASEHPLALAVRTAAQDLKLPERESFSAFPGQGLSGVIEAKNCLIGSPRFLAENGIRADLPAKTDLQHATVVGLAVEGELRAWFYLADTLKPEAIEVVKMLKAKGIEPYMLSGDRRISAETIAARLGINKVLAEVMPADKAKMVKQLQDSGLVVGMVGDGINDAPALKQADIGFAMGLGTDIAIEAADITLLRSEISLIPQAINLSEKTFSKIKQNLFWAFFYNLIAIPLAAFGILHPVIAEIAMAGSSVTVVTNANLLKKSKLA